MTFDTYRHIHCEMISKIKLINTSVTSCHYLCVCICVVRTFKIYSLGNFPVHNTALLTIISMMYIRCPEVIHLITESLYPLAFVESYQASYRFSQPKSESSILGI